MRRLGELRADGNKTGEVFLCKVIPVDDGDRPIFVAHKDTPQAAATDGRENGKHRDDVADSDP